MWSMRVSFASAGAFSAQRRRGERGLFSLPSGTCGGEAARRSRCARCRSYTFGRALCSMGVYQRVEYAPSERRESCGCKLRERFAEVEKTSPNPRGGGAGCRGSPRLREGPQPPDGFTEAASGAGGLKGWGDLRGFGQGSSNITDNTSACPRKDQGQHHNIITTSQHYDKGYKGRYLRIKSFYIAAAFTFRAGEGGWC